MLKVGTLCASSASQRKKTIRSENVCALTRFKYSPRIHPRLDTLANCHRQHLASGALPQLEHLSVAALVMDSME